MPANTAAIFGLTPVIKSVSIATANANRDGTGTIGTLVTGGTNGTRLDKVVVKATVTTTAGVVRLYLDDGAANIYLVDEMIVDALTPSATVKAFRGEFQLGFAIPNAWILKISTERAETFRCFAFGADY